VITTATDILGTQDLVGCAVSSRWSADVSAFKPRHLSAASKPMAPAYEVQTINGFHRWPSEGST
jgi:hypothetical protein